jgi:hypothetical protein
MQQKGRTPEEVAEDARRYEVTEFLKQQRQDAAGQFAYKDDRCSANIWIGDQVLFAVRSCLAAYIMFSAGVLCT